jgi:membrane-associated phospholipid phosphatase
LPSPAGLFSLGAVQPLNSTIFRHRLGLAPLAIGASLLVASPAQASERDWAQASDVGRDVLFYTALGYPAVQGDWAGVGQAALALGSTRLVTDGLKDAVGEKRPDGSDNRSFPSGHTSMSFAAAGTLHKRYGWKIGIPAHAVAAFVGAARVKADKHYVHDVIAGAALGEAAAWLITRRQSDKVQWLPWGDTRGAGVSLVVRN